jgi:hypothetical protein
MAASTRGRRGRVLIIRLPYYLRAENSAWHMLDGRKKIFDFFTGQAVM